MIYTDEDRKKDFDWFLNNYDELYKEYGDSYIVIRNGKVIGNFNSAGEGVRKTSRDFPIGTFIVQHCNGKVSGYTNYITSMNFMGERS
mgnify:CR=1 FL=1